MSFRRSPWVPFGIALTFLLLAAGIEHHAVVCRPYSLFEMVEHYFLRSLALQLLLAAPLLFLPRRGAAWYGATVIPLNLGAMIFQTVLAKGFALPVEKQLFSMLSVSSSAEIAEFTCGFFRGIAGWSVIAGVFALAGLGVLLFRLAGTPDRTAKAAGVLLTLPFGWMALGFLAQGCPRQILNTGTLPRIVLAWNDHRTTLVRWTEMANAPRIPAGLHRTVPGDLAGVVVIGESATRRHLSLYGYPRATTPGLDRNRGELVCFDDVWASDNHTAEALSWDFSFAVPDDPARHPGASLCELLKRAGFRVVLLSNQDRWGEFDTPVNLLFRSADRKVYLSEVPGSLRQDGELLPLLAEELAKTDRPVVVFLHLMECHIPFQFRYLPGTEAFPEQEEPPAPYRDAPEAVRTVVNRYDSALRHGSDTVAGSLELLKKSGRPGFWLYFSDHGEGVYPGMTEFRPRDPEARSTCEVPLVVWLPPGSRKERPELFAALRNNAPLPFQCDRLIYGILHLAGVDYPGFPATEDLFSPQYRPRKRHAKANLLH